MTNLSYGISMLIDFKEAILKAELGTEEHDFLLSITHCGKSVAARKIDKIIENLMDYSTECANHAFMEKVYRSIDKEWSDLGFCESPANLNEEQRAELRAIAKKFYPEDGEDE